MKALLLFSAGVVLCVAAGIMLQTALAILGSVVLVLGVVAAALVIRYR